MKERRKYRKRHELPDPTQSPHAYVNRHDGVLHSRIDREVLARFHRFVARSGLTKKQGVEQAIMSLLGQATVDEDDPDLLLSGRP